MARRVMEGSTDPTHIIEMMDQIHAVEFSPYEWSQDLIAVGLASKIIIGYVRFKEGEGNIEEEMNFDIVREFHHDSRIHALAWSPRTSLQVVPKCLEFGGAGSDYKIRLYSSDLAGKDTIKTLAGHTDYVNSIVYQADDGEVLASVSDDHTCKLWEVKEGCCVHTFYLSSPGMSVCWHREELAELMVAEKSGIIQLYNIETQQAIITFDSGIPPLTAADWSPTNSLRIAALSGGELLVWDVTRPSVSVEKRPVHTDGGRCLKFSKTSDVCIASTGRPGNQLKVTNLHSKYPIISVNLQVFGGITWHYRVPYVCVGSDRSVLLWKVLTK